MRLVGLSKSNDAEFGRRFEMEGYGSKMLTEQNKTYHNLDKMTFPVAVHEDLPFLKNIFFFFPEFRCFLS